MSFKTELYTLLNSNTALKAAVSNNLYYQNLPDNFNPASNAVVYYTKLSDSEDTLAKNNVLDIIELTFVVVSMSTKTIDDIVSIIRGAYDNYSGGKFRDFKITGDDIAEQFERDNYVQTITYKLIYEN